MKNEIKTFIDVADFSLIQAVQSVCRRKFPRTVEAFDSFTASDIETIKRGGLRALSVDRLRPLTKAMKKDDFIFSVN
jgi:hypothetical protein